ncbi:MAG: cyclase family protein [Saprospiraceae bacterium]|nr:cyclase family protein [Candidatus Defluviibacterium haderslevense]
MNIEVEILKQKYKVNLKAGIDISIPLSDSLDQVNCFYAPLFKSEPVRMGTFVGSVLEGGPVNFNNILLNVHGNGTHTECIGHLTKELISVNSILKEYVFINHLISVTPEKKINGDLVIEKQTLEPILIDLNIQTLTIRTLSNDILKRSKKYSGTNPIYFSKDAMDYIVSKNVKHLLVDIPSVDREEDNGLLLAHRSFWKDERALNCTITELIYVPNEVPDGVYLLLLQAAPMELDAVPSRPILYPLTYE